jgi:hypothetical protein
MNCSPKSFQYLLLMAFAILALLSSSAVSAAKVIAVHYSGPVFAPALWGYVNPARIDADFARIRADGFNTVIVAVPWIGFQPHIESVQWSERHFALLGSMMEAAKKNGLGVALRLGYAHDLSVTAQPSHLDRVFDLGRDSAAQRAWFDFLRKVHASVSGHPSFRFSFISWEDFFLLDLPQQSLVARTEAAYRLDYTDAAGIVQPIPASQSADAERFYRFWDRWLLNVYEKSADVFPGLSMEVRVDCEPVATARQYICHEDTFDLGGRDVPTVLYYSPAWGAENRGDEATAAQALGRFRYLLDRVRTHTKHPLFIDQFNFVDNTPGFERNTRIRSDELIAFLEQTASLLETHSSGYGLWTFADVPANVIANGSFELGFNDWKREGKITLIKSPGAQGNQVQLAAGAELSHNLPPNIWVRSDRDIFASTVSAGTFPARLSLEVFRPGEGLLYRRNVTVTEPGSLRFTDLPRTKVGDSLKLRVEKGILIIDDLMLYNTVQENGIYDLNGRPHSFRDAVVAINRRLSVK